MIRPSTLHAHRTRARCASLVLALCAPFAIGCGADTPCAIDDVSRDLGGAGLIDCGLARSTTSSVDACAVEEFQQRHTFRALYEQDDGSIEAIVHAAGDSFHLLRQSDDGSIERADCSGAHVERDGARTYVACDDEPPFDPVCD